MTSRSALEVSIALSDNPRTRPIIDGHVGAEGLRLLPTVVHPSEMFWRQLRYGDFDISEMSLSSLLIATARGDRRWAAIPVYTSRRFFHTSALVRIGSGIERPADLIGKKVGVPEYQQTAAIWSRGILERDFGVRARDIEWHMERGPDRSHGKATGFTPPEGVKLLQVPPTTDIGRMLVEGQLDATLLYIPHANLVDRSRADLSGVTKPLFANAAEEGQRYYRETGIFPINHTLVVKRSLLEQHPWIALNLYTTFKEAAAYGLRAAEAWLAPAIQTGTIDAAAASAAKKDVMPYGLAAARKELETLAAFVHQQGLTERLVKIEELFAENTLEL